MQMDVYGCRCIYKSAVLYLCDLIEALQQLSEIEQVQRSELHPVDEQHGIARPDHAAQLCGTGAPIARGDQSIHQHRAIAVSVDQSQTQSFVGIVTRVPLHTIRVFDRLLVLDEVLQADCLDRH